VFRLLQNQNETWTHTQGRSTRNILIKRVTQGRARTEIFHFEPVASKCPCDVDIPLTTMTIIKGCELITSFGMDLHHDRDGI